ncbi:ribosome alternative rescue factor ArfA [Candidatus Pelagibacter sp.]|nr:ribosome alternative rescue factor ArfA [Candidatus Pelagibacter sp.]
MKVILLNKKKNFIAKTLKDSKFKQRIVKPKKGKGSFKRKKLG